MELGLKRHGSVLASRPLGKLVRSEILEIFSWSEQIVFNLEGVEMVSNSFADECFGKLVMEMDFKVLKNRTSFINAAPVVQKIILAAFSERLKEMEYA